MMSEKRTQILRLAKKFPSQLIKTIKKGNREEDYINHAVINQRLLQVLGASGWDFEPIFEEGKIVAVHGRLTCTVDGKEVTVSGIGCLLYTSPSPRDAHESRMPSSA